MKTNMLSLILSVAALPLLAGAAPEAGECPNLVPNPGFEQCDAKNNPVPWRLPQPFYTVSTNQPHGGQHCLQVVNSDPHRYVLCTAPLSLKAGQRYEISAWVRTHDVAGADNGATICVQWHDAQRKFIGGCYPAGIKGSHADWQRVQDCTGPIPSNAAGCDISCYLRKGMTGTAWWDDVCVREYRPPLIEALTTDCYRDQTEGGRIQVHVGLTLAENDLTEAQVKLELQVRDPAGRVILAGDQSILDTQSWKPGRYEVVCTVRDTAGRELGRRSLTLTRVEKFPPRKAYIDQHRRLIVDGQPFFPLGTYWGGITPEHMSIYAHSPFNCIMPYNAVGRAGLDLAQSNGVRVIYSVKDLYVGQQGIKTTEEARQRITQTVQALKDHPALIAWYINDERPLSMLAELSAHRQWLEELDPGRPTWAVLYQFDQVRGYLSSFDVIGTDPYPIPQKPPAEVLRWARTTVAQTFGCRAVWMVPQIFDWAAYRKTEPDRKQAPPTLAEMRCMAWSCIAAGANGLIFYSWFDLWKMDKPLPSDGHAITREPFAERWRDVTTVAGEIRGLIPTLLAVEPAPTPTVEAPAAIAWRIFAKDGCVYLLCVNSDDLQAATAHFHFPRALTPEETLLGKALPQGAGMDWRFDLPPLGVQMVRFSAGR